MKIEFDIELSYGYIGNRLMGVTDAVSGGTISEPYHLDGSTAYTYDNNGNLKTRVNTISPDNNITDVIYNHLNLPSSLTANWGTVSYVYDALGRKLQSINGTLGQTREYISGIEYQNGSIELIHHSEGRIVRSASDYLYEYYLKDDLGQQPFGLWRRASILPYPTSLRTITRLGCNTGNMFVLRIQKTIIFTMGRSFRTACSSTTTARGCMTR